MKMKINIAELLSEVVNQIAGILRRFLKLVFKMFLTFSMIILTTSLYCVGYIYDAFLDGATEGLQISFNIFPNIIAMVFAINIFLDSNFVYEILSVFEGLLMNFGIPLDILPMAILRPISGTASLAIMNDIFINFGPDSYA